MWIGYILFQQFLFVSKISLGPKSEIKPVGIKYWPGLFVKTPKLSSLLKSYTNSWFYKRNQYPNGSGFFLQTFKKFTRHRSINLTSYKSIVQTVILSKMQTFLKINSCKQTFWKCVTNTVCEHFELPSWFQLCFCRCMNSFQKILKPNFELVSARWWIDILKCALFSTHEY